jgi:uncharacterized damage-inducible protein DinB
MKNFAERIRELERLQAVHPEKEAELLAAGAVTYRQQLAHLRKQRREWPERAQLNQRHRVACTWLETNFTSLAHWRRYVEAVEAVIALFRQEELAQPYFAGCSFMRELVEEDPVLWAKVRALGSAIDTQKGCCDG